MDKEPLVRRDRHIEGLVLEAFNRGKLPVSLVTWSYDEEVGEWTLVVATPLYDSKGPLEANSQVIKALQKAGIYKTVPIRRVSVLSPKDPKVKTLGRNAKEKEITEGAIHIVVHDSGPQPGRSYAVVFAPFTGGGGAIPARHFTSLQELRQFLQEKVQLRISSIEEALDELARKRSASIFFVRITNKEAKKLGLS